jgi:hypothetical protein
MHMMLTQNEASPVNSSGMLLFKWLLFVPIALDRAILVIVAVHFTSQPLIFIVGVLVLTVLVGAFPIRAEADLLLLARLVVPTRLIVIVVFAALRHAHTLVLSARAAVLGSRLLCLKLLNSLGRVDLLGQYFFFGN